MYKISFKFIVFTMFPFFLSAQAQEVSKKTYSSSIKNEQEYGFLVDQIFNKLKTNSLKLPSWAFEVGGTLVVPYSRDYEYASDTGIGLEVGIQKSIYKPYLSFSQSFAHDLYLSGHNRIILGNGFENPLVRVSIMVGFKYQILSGKRFDQYLNENEVLPNQYVTYGVEVLVPLLVNGFYFRLEQWEASKRVLVAQIGAKLYLY